MFRILQLYFIAKTLGVLKIHLFDASRLQIGKINISLRTYYSFLYGYTWYNKYKYFSKNHEVNKIELETFRQMSLRDFEDEDENTLRYPPGITQDSSVAEFMIEFSAMLKSNSELKYGESVLDTFIQIQMKFTDCNKNCTLVVNDANTVQFYDNEFVKMMSDRNRTSKRKSTVENTRKSKKRATARSLSKQKSIF